MGNSQLTVPSLPFDDDDDDNNNISNWRANEASETLTGVTQFENRGCLFVYIYVWTYVCHFVL